MRMSGLFGRTLREDPADAELPSHKLLMRAAFIRPLAAGIYQTRPLGGLIRTREFVMKDAYSFSADEASLDEAYQAQYGAYVRIFERCGLETVAVASDTGIMGGKEAHEFMALSPYGEDTLILCEACGYAANQQIAGIRRDEPSAEPLGAVAEVPTPGCTTIADLCALLGVPPQKTA